MPTSTYLRIAIVLFSATLLAACETGVSETTGGETISLIGKIKLIRLDGGTVPLPYDNVTVNLLRTSSGGGYTETALTTGIWAFRRILQDDYIAYASRPGYGRSEDVVIDATNRDDSTVLVLGEQPRITPTLDSITGSWDSGYVLYAHADTKFGESLDVLVRGVGESDAQFRILLDDGFVIQRDSTEYVAYVNKKPSWFPARPEFAFVAYNPLAGHYWLGYAVARYCSEGPRSNVLTPK